MRGRLALLSRGTIIALAACAAFAFSANEGKQGEWRHYSGDNGAKKYAPFDQIDRTNVGRLRAVWRRPSVSPEFAAANPKLRLTNNYRSTPIMVDGLLYATNAVGLAEAFDPATGKTVWSQRIAEQQTDTPALGGALRAVAYWGEGANARVFTYHRQFLYALQSSVRYLLRHP